MPEFLTITLAVIFCIFILLGCVAAVVSAIMLFQMSSFLLKLADAINDLRKAISEGFDSQVEGQKAVAEGNVQISNQNSQVLMNTLVTLAQMLELILKGLGYTPRIDEAVNSGLQDLEQAKSDYSKPPAPTKQEGLTFPKV
jgi:hypothetical protein